MSKTVSIFFEDVEIYYNSESSQMLRCAACAEVWCDHLAKAIHSRADAATFWGDEEQSIASSLYDQATRLPIDPKNHLYLLVQMNYIEKLHAFQCSFEEPADGTTTRNPFDQVTLGYIHDGEGRSMLAQMFFDWFKGEVQFNDMTCMSEGHGFSQQMAWAESMKSEQARRSEYLCIWATSKCVACERGLVSAGHDYDLIPPDEPKRMSPWKR